MKGSRLAGCALFAMVLLAAVISTATAPAGRYTISGGSVFDTKTQLTWQQAPASSQMAQSPAEAYCNGLGTWRLPSMKELATIVDYETASSPSIDGTAFPSTPASAFWSSTAYNPSAGLGWLVFFDTGGIGPTTVTSNAYVRCVH
jgi:hypothetical protein